MSSETDTPTPILPSSEANAIPQPGSSSTSPGVSPSLSATSSTGSMGDLITTELPAEFRQLASHVNDHATSPVASVNSASASSDSSPNSSSATSSPPLELSERDTSSEEESSDEVEVDEAAEARRKEKGKQKVVDASRAETDAKEDDNGGSSSSMLHKNADLDEDQWNKVYKVYEVCHFKDQIKQLSSIIINVKLEGEFFSELCRLTNEVSELAENAKKGELKKLINIPELTLQLIEKLQGKDALPKDIEEVNAYWKDTHHTILVTEAQLVKTRLLESLLYGHEIEKIKEEAEDARLNLIQRYESSERLGFFYLCEAYPWLRSSIDARFQALRENKFGSDEFLAEKKQKVDEAASGAIKKVKEKTKSEITAIEDQRAQNIKKIEAETEKEIEKKIGLEMDTPMRTPAALNAIKKIDSTGAIKSNRVNQEKTEKIKKLDEQASEEILCINQKAAQEINKINQEAEEEITTIGQRAKEEKARFDQASETQKEINEAIQRRIDEDIRNLCYKRLLTPQQLKQINQIVKIKAIEDYWNACSKLLGPDQIQQLKKYSELCITIEKVVKLAVVGLLITAAAGVVGVLALLTVLPVIAGIAAGLIAAVACTVSVANLIKAEILVSKAKDSVKQMPPPLSSLATFIPAAEKLVKETPGLDLRGVRRPDAAFFKADNLNPSAGPSEQKATSPTFH